MKYISKMLATVCAMMSVIAICFTASLALPVTYNAIARVFGHATTWSFQITLYIFIAAGFLANPISLKSGAHFRIKIIYTYFPRLERILNIFAMLMTIILSLVMIGAGGSFVLYAWTNNISSASIFPVPLWIPEVAIPLGGVGLFLQTIMLLINGDSIDGENENIDFNEE